jgi:alpha-L-fucosidase
LNKKAEASSYRGNNKAYAPANLTDDDPDTYWSTDDAILSASFEINLEQVKPIRYVILQEDIRLGQRVKSFTVEINKNDTWQPVATATTIGYKRILKLDHIESDKIRIIITASKACPVISNVEVY